MNQNPPEDSQEHRQRQAERIAQSPEQYKLCEGCGSIVVIRAVTCPSCHGYLFDTSPNRVVDQAQLLALRSANSVISNDLD